MVDLHEGHNVTATDDRLRRLLAARNREIAALERVARVLGTVGHLQGQALYRQLTDLVLELLDVEICVILRYEPARQSLVAQVPAAGLPDAAQAVVERYRIPVDPSSPAHTHWQAAEPLLINDLSEGASPLVRQLGMAPLVRLAGASSTLLAPLPSQGGPLGLVQVVDKRDGSDFDRDDARLLSIFCRQAVMAIDNAHLFERMERYVAEMASLYEMTAALASAADLDHILALVLEQVRQMLAYDACLISLATADGQTLRIEAVAGQGVDRLLGLEIPVDPSPDSSGHVSGINGWIYRHGRPVLLDDANTDPRRLHIQGQTETFRAVVGVPLIAEGQPIGTIYATRRQPGSFTQAHQTFLTITATQVAAAVQRVRLFDRAQRRAAEMETLLSIATVLASSLDVDHILLTIYQQAGRIMDTSAFFVALYNPDSDELCFNPVYDRGQRLEPFACRLSDSSGLTAHVVRQARPLLIRNWPLERDTLSDVEPFLVGDPTLSWLGVPILVPGDPERPVLGAIGAQSYQPYAFTLRHQRLLAAIANQAGISLQNARLLADLKLVNTDLQEMVSTQAHLLQTIHHMVEAEHPQPDQEARAESRHGRAGAEAKREGLPHAS